MAILRGVLKGGTVLENNIVQTVGSSGESLAAGVIFTVPAFILLGMNISSWTIIALCLLGGFLGVLMMIPLRRYLIVKEHGNLPFPEGKACAEILKAGDQGGGKAKTVFAGIGLGAAYKFLMTGAKLWQEEPLYFLPFLKGGSIGVTATPALLGVGYIIGPRIAALMFGGAVLGYLGISPLIAYIGKFIPPGVVVPPAPVPILELDPSGIREYYIRYMGAGAVVTGGFVSLLKSMPVIISSFRLGFGEITRGFKGIPEALPVRTERELSMRVVLLGSLLIALILWLMPGTNLHLLGALLVLIFGFFFVVVAARIVGIVGSSSSPVSGMTIATLLITSLIFLSLGIKGTEGMMAAMMVGTVVCIAICLSGDISQDLKTGFLLGATPRAQQLTQFIGVVAPALFMGGVVMLLHRTLTLGSPQLPAPQATIMSLVVKGVMTGNLPWIFVVSGMLIAVGIELVGISSLPFAIGLYLPITLSTPIMVCGLIYLVVKKVVSSDMFRHCEEQGILYSSGLVAGDALVGVLIALALTHPAVMAFHSVLNEHHLATSEATWISLGAFAVMTLILWSFTKVKKAKIK